MLAFKARRWRRQRDLIAASGTFDPEWYAWRYLDGDGAADPVEHYVRTGWAAGCFPNTLFDTRWYLDAYGDVRRAGVNPLVHFNAFGFAEGRRPNRWFDAGWFLAQHNGVAVNPLIACRAYAGR